MEDIAELTDLGKKVIKLIISIHLILYLLKFGQLFSLYSLCYACRLFGIFRTVFQYKNKIGNLIMWT